MESDPGGLADGHHARWLAACGPDLPERRRKREPWWAELGAEVLLKPVFGTLADRAGSWPVLLGGLAAFAVFSAAGPRQLLCPGQQYPISRTTPEGDTFQIRTLSDGRGYEIVKNFPVRSQFTADVAAIGADVEWIRLRYFWLATFRLR